MFLLSATYRVQPINIIWIYRIASIQIRIPIKWFQLVIPVTPFNIIEIVLIVLYPLFPSRWGSKSAIFFARAQSMLPLSKTLPTPNIVTTFFSYYVARKCPNSKTGQKLRKTVILTDKCRHILILIVLLLPIAFEFSNTRLKLVRAFVLVCTCSNIFHKCSSFSYI